VYNPLQICLQETCSQEIRLLMMQSAVGSVFIIDDVPLSAIGILLELPSTVTDLLRKPVPPPPPLSRCNGLMLLPRPPPWPG